MRQPSGGPEKDCNPSDTESGEDRRVVKIEGLLDTSFLKEVLGDAIPQRIRQKEMEKDNQ